MSLLEDEGAGSGDDDIGKEFAAGAPDTHTAHFGDANHLRGQRFRGAVKQCVDGFACQGQAHPDHYSGDTKRSHCIGLS